MAQLPSRRHRVFLVGALPPPVHGMSLVNAAMHKNIEGRAADPVVVNLAAQTLERKWSTRLLRMPRVGKGLWVFGKNASSGSTLYMSVSGGLGQLYEILFIVIARIRGLRCF